MKKYTLLGLGLLLAMATFSVFYFLLGSGAAREKRINTLPYANFSKVSNSLKGVQSFDWQKAFKGYNLYNPRNRSRAYLIDMRGNILHQWQIKTTVAGWHQTSLLPNGDLVTIKKDEEIRLIDLKSKTKWQKAVRAHHDVLYHAEDEKIYLLTRRDREIKLGAIKAPLLDDQILVYTKTGTKEKQFSIYDAVKKFVPEDLLEQSYNWFERAEVIEHVLKLRESHGFKYEGSTMADILHTNSIDIVRENVTGCCKKGDLIVSIRNLNLVAIIDSETKKLVWHWGPEEVSRQHHATYINGGKILLFDNGVRDARSRVILVDLKSKKVSWQYSADEFYTELGGGCQMLPNGNVLIAESAKGRAFEVTPEGKTVWNFYNPEFTDATNERAFLYRIQRIYDVRYAKLIRTFKKQTTKKSIN